MAGRARNAVLGAAGGFALLLLIWYATFHVGLVGRADQAILRGFAEFGERQHTDSLADSITRPFGPPLYLLLAATPVLVAIIRRRFWLALAISAILVGANVTTELMKPLLAHPRPASLLGGFSPPSGASFPSGHATAAMSFALCCVLAAPARLRPFFAAASGVLAAAFSASILTLNSHYPSDVLAGFVVAGIWTMLGFALIANRPARKASRSLIT